jgi:hypothetical protein
MKTAILTIFASIVLVSGITKATYAATADKENVTVLTNISQINKIEVYGNVELYVSDGSADEVKVYNKYYAERALVQSQNGVLRISSYKTQKLVVWVTAKDLRSISAYDNSVVKSFGSLSKIELDVDLHNTASAKLNLDAYSANITVADKAKADLTGSVDEFTLVHNIASSVNSSNFAAAHFIETLTGMPVTRNEELAGL